MTSYWNYAIMLLEVIAMSIVKFRKPNGVVYAYEYSSEVDPVTQKSHQVRKYLGRVDEKTGEIINTGGRRGRPAKGAPQKTPAPTTDAELVRGYQEKCEELDVVRKQLERLQADYNSLLAQNAALQQTLQEIAKAVSKVIQ